MLSSRSLMTGFALLLAPFLAIGCGGGNKAKVTGKVVANGQPVTGGTVMFSPIAGSAEEGAPALGEVKSDGSFALGTENPGDGTVPGKHRVTYSPPAQTAPEWDGYGTPPPAPPPSPYAGMEPKEKEVEVKAGSNDITIDLVPGQKQ
jgi:hypothetical protein